MTKRHDCTRCWPPDVRYITLKSKSSDRREAVASTYELYMLSYSWRKSLDKATGLGIEVRRIPRKEKKRVRNFCLEGDGWPMR